MSYITKKALAIALVDLLSTTTLDKITIQMIVDECGVNRQTFYYHFRDVYDLLVWIYETETQQQIKNNMTTDDWSTALKYMLTRAHARKQVVMNTCHSKSKELLVQHLYQVVGNILSPRVMSLAKEMNVAPKNAQFVLEFYQWALVGIVINWIGSGMEKSADELHGQLSMLTVSDVQAMLQKFSNID